jgi:hypothetical protein
MKSLVKKLIIKAVQNNHIWAILDAAFIKVAIYASVAERLITGSFCDANVLQSIPYTKRALIISDCEGIV